MRAVKNLLESGPIPETHSADVSMSFTYTIDPKAGLLIVRAEGPSSHRPNVSRRSWRG